MRLFIAALIPEGLRKELFSIGHEFHPTFKGSIVAEENIHLTLEFLGEVPEAKLAGISEALDGIVCPAFDISLRGLGCFPDSIHPRVLWAGISEGFTELASLNGEIVRKLGSSSSKRFHPHATIARIKSMQNHEGFQQSFNQHKATEFGSFALDSFELMSSELSPAGPKYGIIKSFDSG